MEKLWVWEAMEEAVLLEKGSLQRWMRAKTRWKEASADSRTRERAVMVVNGHHDARNGRAPLVVERPSSLLEVACRQAWVELPKAYG
jgi:hypothetical protein